MTPVERLIAVERAEAFLRQRALMPKMDESLHQQTVIHYATMLTKIDPDSLWQWVHAVSNGGFLVSKATAGRLRGEGIKAGVFDLNLDVARGGKHGLKIEMKKPASLNAQGNPIPSTAGVISPDQHRWHDHYVAQGYEARICYGFKEAIAVIKGYLGG